jgi:thiol-disulfide isomerase/thioredoxin
MFRLATALMLMCLAGAAFALDKQPYSAERFDQLQRAGEVVLIDVFAPWCSTCKRQEAVLAQWAQAHPERKLHVLVVDFDNDKDSVTRFKAPRQSTLLIYQGEAQHWFSVAETRYEVIAAALEQAFAGRS